MLVAIMQIQIRSFTFILLFIYYFFLLFIFTSAGSEVFLSLLYQELSAYFHAQTELLSVPHTGSTPPLTSFFEF